LDIKEVYLGEGNTYPLVTSQKFDYVIDCIDTLTSKCWFIRACIENHVPVATSMGAGGKTDPTRVHLSDISESKYCGFATAVRRRLGKWGIKSGIPVVYSTEEVDPTRQISTPTQLKKTIMGTVSYMPAVFGCMLASVVVRDLAEGVVGGAVQGPTPVTKSMMKRMQHKERVREREQEQLKEGKKKQRKGAEERVEGGKREKKQEITAKSKDPGAPKPLGNVGPSELIGFIVFRRLIQPIWDNKKLITFMAFCCLLVWSLLKLKKSK